MLITVSARSFSSPVKKGARPSRGLPELAALVRNELGVHGLAVETTAFAGLDADGVDRVRDQTDKSGCPVLLLIEPTPQGLAERSDAAAEPAMNRVLAVLTVAHRLGCSGVALTIADPGNAALGAEEIAATRIKKVISRAERLELNVLLSAGPGLTETPEALTALIRKVGGFRIGAFPDFAQAAASGNSANYLRTLTPYASAIRAVIDPAGKGDDGSAFKACLSSVLGVGYDGMLALEWRGAGDPLPALKAARSLIDTLATEGDDEE